MTNKDGSEKQQAKKKLKKRTIFTIISVVNIVWYTITVLVLSYSGAIVPSELTVAWFSAWTVELALLYGIKVRSKDSVDDNGSNTNAGYTTTTTNNYTQTSVEVQDATELESFENNDNLVG